jgi:hypothetical protein
VLEAAVLAVEPEQQGADDAAGLVPAEAGHDAVGRALVLHLEHRARVGGVRRVERLGDDAVEAGALEDLEPLAADRDVGARRRQVDRRRGLLHELLESRPALAQGRVEQRLVALGKEVERDERGRRLLGELAYPRLGWVDPVQQRVEVEPVTGDDHDLAVDDAALGQARLDRVDDLGEVAGQRPLAPAGQLDLVAVAEHDAAEAVPLGLVQKLALGHPLDRLGEHRGDRRRDWELHGRDPLRSLYVIGSWRRVPVRVVRSSDHVPQPGHIRGSA